MNDPASDAALPAAFLAGDEAHERGDARIEEITTLFGQLRNPLLRYLLAFGVSVHHGEEIIQEVFLALWKHLEDGKPRTNLQAWTFRVSHNLALKHLSTTSREVPATETAVEAGHADLALNPEEQLAVRQRRERLQSVLRALPEQDRYCIYLRAEGLRYREIAEVLDISLGAVSSSLVRALGRFQRADQG